jgi:hypothetical protein
MAVLSFLLAEDYVLDFKNNVMRYIILSLVILFISNFNCFSQEKKFTVRTGAGYYTDLMGMYDGPALWLEGGYKFNTGFYLNGRVSVASVDWTMSEGFFENYKTMAVRQMADITFSRPVKLTGQHYLEPGLGFKLKREYNFYPDLTIQTINEQTYFYTRYSQIFYEIGFTIYLDYYYQFSSGFYLGLRTDTNVIWAVGFEGLTISPLFGFRF